MNRGREPDACLSKPPECLGSRKLERSDVDLHEVRLHLLEIDRQPGLDETLCEPSRPQVVVRQPLDVVLERIEPGGRHDPRLSHRAAEQMLLATGLLDPGS